MSVNGSCSMSMIISGGWFDSNSADSMAACPLAQLRYRTRAMLILWVLLIKLGAGLRSGVVLVRTH